MTSLRPPPPAIGVVSSRVCVRQLLVIGPFPWGDLQVAPGDWRDCQVTEAAGGAGVLRLLRRRGFDVLVTHPSTSATEDLELARDARALQPGLRVVVLAPEVTPADVIAALREEVFGCFSIPTPPDELREAIGQALDEMMWQNGIHVLTAVPHWIALRVACRRITADRLTRFMTELAGDVVESDRFTLIAAFRELLLNAMEHGAGFDENQVVDVHAVRTRRSLVYYFKDPGPGFNVASPGHVATAGDPIGHMQARQDDGQRPGGFGMLLTRKLVDEVHYNELGNEVFLVKYLD
jgi:anti-sigma regulatory factor (Ser/Thr protein kinase)/CheY-like chemotaxis protein